MTLSGQFVSLLILAIPVASVSWTVTHEEVFREPREFCKRRSESCKRLIQRKFFYLFTCEYCFSHYISAAFIWITRYQLLFDGWRGYLISWLALVWVSNVYMSLFGHIRLEIKSERVEIEKVQEEVKAIKEESGDAPRQPDRRRVA
jgi:hypothetical protein